MLFNVALYHGDEDHGDGDDNDKALDFFLQCVDILRQVQLKIFL